MRFFFMFALCVLFCVSLAENVNEKSERVKIGEQFKDAVRWLRNRFRALRSSLSLGSNKKEIMASLRQIRGRIIFFRDALRRGVSIDELRAFRDIYIIGYSDEELAQMDLEIEHLLSSFDEGGSDFGLSVSVAGSLPLELPSNLEIPSNDELPANPELNIGSIDHFSHLKQSHQRETEHFTDSKFLGEKDQEERVYPKFGEKEQEESVYPKFGEKDQEERVYPKFGEKDQEEKSYPKFGVQFRKSIAEKIPDLNIKFTFDEESHFEQFKTTEVDDVCFKPTLSAAVVTTTSVQQINSDLVQTDLWLNSVTETLTSTLVIPVQIVVTEIVTVSNAPQLLTSTVSLRPIRFTTVTTLLTNIQYETESINLLKAEREVLTSFTHVLVPSPVYITSLSVNFLTTSTTVTLERIQASTMTFTDTTVHEVSVTSTMTKVPRMTRWVTHTELAKTMVPSLSTITSYNTVTKCHTEGFLEGVKKWGKAWNI